MAFIKNHLVKIKVYHLPGTAPCRSLSLAGGCRCSAIIAGPVIIKVNFFILFFAAYLAAHLAACLAAALAPGRQYSSNGCSIGH